MTKTRKVSHFEVINNQSFTYENSFIYDVSDSCSGIDVEQVENVFNQVNKNGQIE